MVQNNADQSFASLTITELLHPEMAASVIRRRNDDESAWATVYYEAVSGPLSYEDMPVAFNVVAIHDDIEDTTPQHPQESGSCRSRRIEEQGPHQDDANALRPLPKPQPWQHSNLVDLILGFALTLSAFICTIKIELTAILIYTIAAGAHYLAEEVFSSSAALLGRSICLVICGTLMVVDPILLTVSVIVTELIGWIALLLCTVFGDSRSGNAWHQFIRKTCHLSRWGFRSCHKGWKPERIFPFSMEDERMQLTSVPCHEAEEGIECPESPRGQYSDVATSHHRCTCCGSQFQVNTGSCCCTEESTMISEVTFLENDMECAPIAIAPENVSVVHDDLETQEQNDPLFKNTQQVIMV